MSNFEQETMTSYLVSMIKKIEDGVETNALEQSLGFLVMLSSYDGIFTKELILGLAQRDDFEMISDLIEKIATVFPTHDQRNAIDYGMIISGFNTDGSIAKWMNKKSKKGNTHTYVIKDKNDGLIKIGRSTTPKKRIKTISTTSGRDLEVLIIINDDVEKELHTRFSNIRVNGEWFNDVHGHIGKYCNSLLENKTD